MLSLINLKVPQQAINVSLSTHLVSVDATPSNGGLLVSVSVDRVQQSSATLWVSPNPGFNAPVHIDLVSVPTVAITTGLSVKVDLAYNSFGNLCSASGSTIACSVNATQIAHLNPTLITDATYNLNGVAVDVHREVGVSIG